MMTIAAILEPSDDGTLHLSLPKGLPPGKVEVVAKVHPLARHAGVRKAGCLKGFWMSPDFNEPLEDFAEYL